MHILHFCGALKGGPLTAIAEWTRQQTAAGHRVSLVYSPLRDPLDGFRADLAPEVALFSLDVRRDIHPISDFRACLRLAEMLRVIRPDILHLHSSKAGAIGRIAARLTGVPSVYSTHGMAYLRTDVGVFSRALYFALEWVLGPIGTVSVACSPSELQSMRAIPGRKMDIPNGIDLATLPPPPERPGNDNLKIALCGRITAQKNPKLACQIAKLSPREWRWVWLGDGELGDMVAKAGIVVSGWQSRAKAIAMLGACDVLLHTSSWEGMPIAILEAMALGLPVVATNAVGNRDLVIQDKTGFIAVDAAGFVTALKTLAASSERRHRLGSAGRRRVEQEFDQSKLAARWLALYENFRAKS
jgi:glycosyltransferase involved in cell wall biosynthesis